MSTAGGVVPGSGGVGITGVGAVGPGKDATQVVYSWLPHSTALGPSSAVSLRIRNASLIGALPGRFGPTSAVPSLDDEKKCDEEGGGGGAPRPSELQCRVEAAVHCHGLSLQAAPVSTAYAPLIPSGGGRHRADGTGRTAAAAAASAQFDATMSLPVRWRDLTRDACVALNVFCEGGLEDRVDDGRGADGASRRASLGAAASRVRSRVWGTTLPLFDRTGRLRSGLVKLDLHDRAADGGMGYRCKIGGRGGGGEEEEEVAVETFLDGGATPGLSPGRRFRRPSDAAADGEEEDPKWKASRILHELDHRAEPSSGSAAGGADGPGASTNASAGAGPPASRTANAKPASWLDALTRERCLDVLAEEEEDDDEDGRSSRGSDGRDPSAATTTPVRRSDPAPTSSRRDRPYLVAELPASSVPVLHEEPRYPVEAASLRGATGSISARELIKFHARYRAEDAEGGAGAGGSGEGGGGGGEGWTVRFHPSAATDAALPSSPQAFLYPLVQLLDHEPPPSDEREDPRDNPAQDKYRILAHDLIRGLVDPGLKPDRVQRGRLERIVGSPSYHLSTEEKDLLWRFRFSLVDNRRALTKFLVAVDWTVESETVQAAELLEQWRKRSPIEVTDALKLLGRNVAFQTSLVRSYAIETLSDAPDEELRLYFLQLVQALKYEEDVSGGSEAAAAAVFSRSDGGGGGGSDSTRGSSLSAFLIERASRNVELANFLYWYLRVEMLEPNYDAKYREVFLAFQAKLSSVHVHNGIIVPSAQESSTTLWELLSCQEQFISGLLEVQKASLLVRGKKDAKEAHLREALEAGGFRKIPHAVPLPSAPHVWVKGVDCESAKMFKSALYPTVLDFRVDHVASNDKQTGATAGTKAAKQHKEELKLYKVMIKTGDDLRQDQLVIMMIQLMDRLLKRGTLDLCLRPYLILAMPNNTGLMEFVQRSHPVSQILSGNNNSIMAFFQKCAPQEGARHSVKPDVMQTYIRSCAGYCVLTYILGVGDRHLDNIMIQPTGHFFHIDFGFIFGRDPKPLPPAFRLTKEMVDGMGGTDSKEYRQFCSLACQAFNVLRKSAGLVLNLLHLMSDAGIEDLSHNPSADAIGVLAKVEERFKLELTDEQAEQFFIGLINESLAALAPRVMEMFHQLSVARR